MIFGTGPPLGATKNKRFNSITTERNLSSYSYSNSNLICPPFGASLFFIKKKE